MGSRETSEIILMKFDCGETWEEKKKRLENWHRWFAWHPAKIKDHDCRVFEYVWRKGTYDCGYKDCYWNWEYKSIEGEEPVNE